MTDDFEMVGDLRQFPRYELLFDYVRYELILYYYTISWAKL